MPSGRISNLAPDVRDDWDALVAAMAVKHRYKEAARRLMAVGARAADALRRGLGHEDASVRIGCLYVLDHFMDDAAIDAIVRCLDDENPHVRARALHTLACDRCKEGSCRPAEDAVVPIALRLLETDPHRRVRTMAADMLGQVVHRFPEVALALSRARDTDPHPVVRKVAGWGAPGGPRFLKTKNEPSA